MKKFFSYLLGIIGTPVKTLQKIVDDKNSKKYIPVFFIVLFVYALMNRFFLYQNFALPIHSGLLLKNFFDISRNYGFLVSPFVWAFVVFIQHKIAHFFSKNGEYSTMLTCTGFISIASGFLSYVFIYASQFFPLARLLQNIILLWSVCLNVLTISIVYKISKKKAFRVIIINTGLIALLLLLGILCYLFFAPYI